MADSTLAGRRILIVEDEYLIATTLADDLSDEGAQPIGPVATVQDALALIAATPHLEFAVLDVNLNGEAVYPVADVLKSRNVPFVLVTGYDLSAIPERYRDAQVVQKPIETADVVNAIRRLAT